MSSLYKTIGQIRENKPLVHHITNIVTINDCANITLAIGATPIMAMDPNEVEEVTSRANALVLNVGTLNQLNLKAMILSGKVANELGIPVVLDPTGVGISKFRKTSIEKILSNIKVDIIKGNTAEIKTLLGLDTMFKGVDSLDLDEIDNLIAITNKLAKKLDAVVICTGKTDIISSSRYTTFVEGGNPMIKEVTGTGCMLGSLIGAFAGVQFNKIEAAQMGAKSMKIAAELSYKQVTQEKRGNSSYKMFLIDEIYKLGS